MNKELTTITVLDYESGKVTQYNVDKWKIDKEDILTDQGHRLSNIHWMIHEDATIYVK